jgi:transposase
MHTLDARSLPAAAQEDLRRRVVKAVHAGLSQSAAARVFGVARGTINGWMQRYSTGGTAALRGRRRGRPPGSTLAPKQARAAVRLILTRCPDQLRLPFALWTREAVQQLLAERFQLAVSVWTVGRYLKAWGLTPQKPLRRAYEQDPAAVRRWLQAEYPVIRDQARRAGAAIQWLDEMGLRSDHQAGRSYGRRGQTPVIPGPGQRFGCNLISTVTNRGRLTFMVFSERFTARVFRNFLRRLLRQHPRKLFLILDRHPVHRAAPVQRWVARHEARLRLFFLPAYSPELNPDELLNQDVKTNAVGRRRARDAHELLQNVRGYLRSTQRQPDIVQSYFQEPHVCYAAT